MNIRFKIIDSAEKEHIRKKEVKYSKDLIQDLRAFEKYYKAKRIYFFLYGNQYCFNCETKRMEVIQYWEKR